MFVVWFSLKMELFRLGSQLDGRANDWLVGGKCPIAAVCGDIPKTQSKRSDIAKVSLIGLYFSLLNTKIIYSSKWHWWMQLINACS